jgi:hypothetical protein
MIAETTTFAIAALGLAAYLMHLAFKGFSQTAERIRRIRLRNAEIEQWPTVRGRVLRLGIDCEYLTPEEIERVLDTAQGDTEEVVLKRIEALAQAAVRRQQRHGGVLIAYAYEYDGRRYRGRALSPVFESEHRDWIYRYRRGGGISLKVNPKRPVQAFIGPNTARGMVAHERKLNRTAMRHLTGSTGLFVLGIFCLMAAIAL